MKALDDVKALEANVANEKRFPKNIGQYEFFMATETKRSILPSLMTTFRIKIKKICELNYPRTDGETSHIRRCGFKEIT